MLVGKVAYWLCYPLLAIYLRLETRGRIVVWHDGRVLLVKSWLDKGEWYLPGGGIHRDEAYDVGSARELFEETGIQCDASELRHIESFRYRDGLIGYDCVAFSIHLRESVALRLQKSEIVKAQWFTVEEIDALKMHSSIHRLIKISES